MMCSQNESQTLLLCYQNESQTLLLCYQNESIFFVASLLVCTRALSACSQASSMRDSLSACSPACLLACSPASLLVCSQAPLGQIRGFLVSLCHVPARELLCSSFRRSPEWLRPGYQRIERESKTKGYRESKKPVLERSCLLPSGSILSRALATTRTGETDLN